jgi:predicted small lipoprotein YifL
MIRLADSWNISGGCHVDRADYRSYLRMKKLFNTSILIATLLLALIGCGSPGPSPEQQAREADQQREAERQQKEFRKSLPPVGNPGQGW